MQNKEVSPKSFPISNFVNMSSLSSTFSTIYERNKESDCSKTENKVAHFLFWVNIKKIVNLILAPSVRVLGRGIY